MQRMVNLYGHFHTKRRNMLFHDCIFLQAAHPSFRSLQEEQARTKMVTKKKKGEKNIIIMGDDDIAIDGRVITLPPGCSVVATQEDLQRDAS